MNADVPYVNGFGEISKFSKFKLEAVNWSAEYPYCPDVEVALGHTDGMMLVKFSVAEKCVRAVCLETNGPVWEDSCVEVFIRVPGDEHYFNFETNCIGTMLASRRMSRAEYTRLDTGTISKIIRRSSFPHEILEKDYAQWTLELEIPFSVLGLDNCPEMLEANFYKCGDKCAIPHFVSWNPIKTEKPDFHRPEFFGTLVLQG